MTRTIRLPRATAAVVAALSLAACDSYDEPSPGLSPTAPSVQVPFSTTDLAVGTGASAIAGNRVTLNYNGWLYDASAPDNKGRLFDSSTTSGPFTFVLGAGQAIAGWDQGIPGMRVGGVRRLVIPPQLAYGSEGRGLIPPNATLVFEVELVRVS